MTLVNYFSLIDAIPYLRQTNFPLSLSDFDFLKCCFVAKHIIVYSKWFWKHKENTIY